MTLRNQMSAYVGMRRVGVTYTKPGGTAGRVYTILSQQNDWDRIFLFISNIRCPFSQQILLKLKGDKNMSVTKEIPYKIYLEESEMPKAWYNLRADMINKPAPLLNAETMKPMTAEELGWCSVMI